MVLLVLNLNRHQNSIFANKLTHTLYTSLDAALWQKMKVLQQYEWQLNNQQYEWQLSNPPITDKLLTSKSPTAECFYRKTKLQTKFVVHECKTQRNTL